MNDESVSQEEREDARKAVAYLREYGVEVKFIERSLSDLIYDLVVQHVRDWPDCLDGWVSSKDGTIQIAVSIQQDDDQTTAIVYQDQPLTDGDKQVIIEQINEEDQRTGDPS
jgi:hypothetical protein